MKFFSPQNVQEVQELQKAALRKLSGPSGRSNLSRAAVVLGVGAALAAAAYAVRQRTQQAERDNPPLGQFIEVDGVRLHYLERGRANAQPLVLFHGNGMMIQDFDISGLLDLAADKYRVIVFDRPGYGYSERPNGTVWGPVAQAKLLHQALLQLRVDKPVVVGHSWGTLVAVSLALEFPSYVKSLALLSGYYYPTARLDIPFAAMPAIPLIGSFMRHTVSPLLGRLIWPLLLRRRLFGPAPVPHRFSEYPVWMTLRPSQLQASAAEAAMMIPAAASLSKRYHELSMPVVIMAGSDDKHVSALVHSERLHRELPQSDLHLRPRAGHMIHHLVPHEVMMAIDQAAEAEPLDLELERITIPQEPMRLH